MGDRGNAWLRRLDRFVGIPLVWSLGLGHRPRPPVARPGPIGVLATAAIGDTILMSAVLADIAAAHPESPQTLFVGPSNRGMAELACPAARVVEIPVDSPGRAARRIRAEGTFDWWIDFGPWPRLNAVLSHAARAGCKVGFRTAGQHRHFIYDRAVDHHRDRHELENLRALAGALGVRSEHRPRLEFPPVVSPSDPVVVHMFPGGYRSHFKEWSDDRWGVLLRGLCDDGHTVVVTGAGKDRPAAARILAAAGCGDDVQDWTGRVSLADTGSLLAAARLLVSVNTGIMHLAAAVGTPLIALHGPTDVRRWGPLAPNAVNFCATSTSAGCLNLGFEYDPRDPHSLDTIEPGAVLAAARTLLDRRAGERNRHDG